MAVRIRLKRAGSRHKPFYKIIVTDSRRPRDGAAIESLGFYNPLSHPEKVEVNEERYDHWISVGARASEPVETLLRRLKRRAASGETPEESVKPLIETPIAEADSAEGQEIEPQGETDGDSPAGAEVKPGADAESGAESGGESDKQ